MQEVNLPNYRLLQLGAPNRAGAQRNEQFDDPNECLSQQNSSGKTFGVRNTNGAILLAAILLLCGCASTHASGKEELSSTIPTELIGVWHRNDNRGRQLCDIYKKARSAQELDEKPYPLVGSLVITKAMVHAYSDYGEGNFYVVKRVADLGNKTWEIMALLGIDGIPTPEYGKKVTSRLMVRSGLLSMEDINAPLDNAYPSHRFFRCGKVIDGLYVNYADIKANEEQSRGD